MAVPLLDVRNIFVSVDSKSALRGVSLQVGAGETHVLMGPNGAGKSTLGNTLMGNPAYHLDSGEIFFDGRDISGEAADKRARAGLFMSFQNPIEISGISLEVFIRSAIQQKTGGRVKLFQFQKDLEAAMALLGMDPSYARRDINVGFSGGERKKSEVLQMMMLRPKLAVLDETDSGLDVDAARAVSRAIGEFQRSSGAALIVITHATRILESLRVDAAHVMSRGAIARTGGSEIVDEINANGFERLLDGREAGGE